MGMEYRSLGMRNRNKKVMRKMKTFVQISGENPFKKTWKNLNYSYDYYNCSGFIGNSLKDK